MVSAALHVEFQTGSTDHWHQIIDMTRSSIDHEYKP